MRDHRGDVQHGDLPHGDLPNECRIGILGSIDCTGHTDVAFQDVAHSDGAVSHVDTPHTDTHGDTPHADRH